MPPFFDHKNKKLFIYQHPLVENRDEDSVLTADASSGDGTITVKNINRFSTDQILLIGELGQEDAEIIKTHSSTSPSGNTVTLASNLSFDHVIGEKVYIISYDKVELSHASTATGSKSTLSTGDSGLIDLEADNEVVVYDETEHDSGFYFARFKNSISNSFGDYTDALPYDGWNRNQAGYLALAALRELDVDFSDNVTIDWLSDALNDGVRRVLNKQKRWSEYQNLNAKIANTVRGELEYSMPSDIYDDDSIRSIVSVRIGGEDDELLYYTPEEFEEYLDDLIYTEVRTQATSGDTTLAVDNSYDFDDGDSDNPPTLTFYVDGTKHTITYTGVTRDDEDGGTAQFSGIPSSGDNSISVTIPTGTKIYQNPDEGQPLVFTVRNGQLEIAPVPDGDWDDKNIYMDYWTVPTDIQTAGDTLDNEWAPMMLDYLIWRVWCKTKNDNVRDRENSYFIDFKQKLNDFIRTRVIQNPTKARPNLNKIDRDI